MQKFVFSKKIPLTEQANMQNSAISVIEISFTLNPLH